MTQAIHRTPETVISQFLLIRLPKGITPAQFTRNASHDIETTLKLSKLSWKHGEVHTWMNLSLDVVTARFKSRQFKSTRVIQSSVSKLMILLAHT